MLRKLPAPVGHILARPGAREALRDESRVFSPATRQRGQMYTDRITQFTAAGGNAITARVQGTHEYVVTWLWDEFIWDHACSCPVGFECKHAYAVAISLLKLRAATEDDTTSPVTHPSPQSDENLSLQHVALDQLRHTNGSWSRRHPLGLLLKASRLDHVDVFAADFTAVLEEPDSDILFWRLAAKLAEVVGDEFVPTVLKPYLQRDDIAESVAARARGEAFNLLQRWSRERQISGKKQLRFDVDINIAFRPALMLEVRLTSARLRDQPRTGQQLQQLADEAHREVGVLSRGDRDLLDVYLRTAAPSSFTLRNDCDPRTIFQLAQRDEHGGSITWSTDMQEDVAQRTGIEPGSSLRCGFDPVRIQPELFGEGARVLTGLFAVWPDGRRRRMERCVLFESSLQGGRDASILLSDGMLWQVVERPPIEVLRSFASAGSIEIPPAARAELLPQLAASFANIDATLSLHARHVPVDPVVVLELRRDDWLHVRTLARQRGSQWSPGQAVPPGEKVYEHMADGRWVVAGRIPNATTDEDQPAAFADAETSEPPESNLALEDTEASPPEHAIDEADAWLELPDPRATRAVVDWVARIGAVPHADLPSRQAPGHTDVATGRWLRFAEETIGDFFAAWNERPRATYLGNRRLRRVLAGTDTIRPKVKIEASGTDWFSVSATWAAEGLSLSDADVTRLRGARSEFVRLSTGWVRREAIEEYDQAATMLADLGIELDGGTQRISLWQLAGANEASVAAVMAMGADAGAIEALKTLRRRIDEFTGVPELPLPNGLEADLRPYQRRGLDFLGHTASLGLGAILADDMGLGKTLQALAWLAWLQEKRRGSGPALVVCPASVAHNWVREAERFAPQLRVLLLGSGPEREEQRKQWRRYDLIITNYALLRRDKEFWEKRKLRALILDEAQNIKNPDAVVARIARSLEASFRLALTGTPMENRALDLWSLVEFVNPGYLGRRSDFVARYDRNELPAYQRQLLAAKLRPILLRRLKRDVATELPERIEERIDCELTTGQRKHYLAELRRSRALVDDIAGDPDALNRNKIQVLAALTRLRQICCHPALAGGPENLGSGKFDALFELLGTILAEGHKVLLFSQFVRCLERISTEMEQRGIPQHMLTGRSRNREEIVRAFQEDEQPCVFLVSLKAGGTGLNLTAASYVVLFDPWWNPAVEAQAIDRTHRIGQDKTVIAYRLLAAGTVEEKIFELQQRKANLARDVLGEDGFARSLSRDDLAFLLSET